MKPTLFMTKGLPASGKTTFAKEQVLLSKGKTKRVNKDDLRAMVDAGKWSKHNEGIIVSARNVLVSNWLVSGLNVIVDDTNFAPTHEQALRTIAKDRLADFKLVDFTDVSVEDCIKRDLGRPGAVGQNVILEMYYKYLCAPPVKHNPNLPLCVITDVDGTIAKSTGRGSFEENRVSEDAVRPFVKAAVLGTLAEYTADLIVFSGRQNSCLEDTHLWLQKYGFIANALHMRAAGDRRPDYVVKTELYRKHIEDKYNVVAIFDDRPQVLRAWEALGLGDRLFRCGETMREF